MASPILFCCGRRPMTHWDGWLCRCYERAHAEKDTGASHPF